MVLSDDFPLVDRNRLCWDTSSKLGEGSFGIVYRGEYDASPVAIKVIKRPQSDSVTAINARLHQSAALKQHRREINRYHVMRNQYIIQHLGSFRGDDPRDLYIVTEYMEGGSLHESLLRMRERGAMLDEMSFLTIASHIARGLLHVHNQQLTHGDIKPQNVLLTAAIQLEPHPGLGSRAYLPPNAKVKIADFGLSKRLEGAISPHLLGSTAATADFGTGAVGTYLYMSPQAYKGTANVSDDVVKASDIYAYGLVLFELLSGLQSWALEGVRNLFDLMLHVSNGRRPSWGPRRNQIDSRYIKLVEQCWSQNPADRPTIQDVVTHLNSLLQSYQERISSQASESMPNVIAQSDSCTNASSSDHNTPQVPMMPNVQYNPLDVNSLSTGVGDSSDSESFSNQPSSLSNEDHLERKSNAESAYTDIQESDSFGPPGLVHVESTKLTQSEVRNRRIRFPGPRERSLDSISACDENSHDSDGSITGDVGLLDLAKQESGIQRDDIDHNVGEIVELKHVKSSLIPPPKVDGLQLPTIVPKPTEDGFADGPPRTNSDLLKSFAKPFSEPKPTDPTPNDESGSNDSEKFSKVSQPEDTSKTSHDTIDVEAEKHDSSPQGARVELYPGIFISTVQAEPLKNSPARPQASPHNGVSLRVNSPERPEGSSSPEGPKKNSYTSPENVEIDSKVLSELEQNDKHAFDASTAYNQGTSQSGVGKMTPTQIESSDPGQFLALPSKPSANQATSQPPQTNFANHQSGWNYPSQADHHIQSRPSFTPIRPSISHPEMSTSFRIPPYAPDAHSGKPSTDYGSFVYPPTTGVPPSSASWPVTHQEPSAPPLTDTSQSALGGTSTHQRISLGMQSNISPPWQPIGSSHSNPHARQYPHPFPSDLNVSTPTLLPLDVNALLNALRRTDGIAVADGMWRHGNRRLVAEALAHSSSLGGASILSCTTRYLAMNNDLQPDRKDPYIAMNLCIAIGNFARNDPQAISPTFVSHTLCVVLLVMPNFFHLGEGKAQVFAACCYALSNLFKISNVIKDASARSNTAGWIEYATSYNITGEKSNGAPFSDSLAYNAACAARNFMWMNEVNVQAFVACSPHGETGRGLPITILIESMHAFAMNGKWFVVEASLSALAMVILYPRQRVQFIRRHGFKVFFNTSQLHPLQPSIVSLVFWMITTIFSGLTSPNESEAFWNSFVIDQGSQQLVRSIIQVRRGVVTEKERVELLEHGFYAVLAVIRFHASMRKSLIDSGCLQQVHTALTDISSSAAVGVQNVDKLLMTHKARLGTVLCDVMRELGADADGYGYLRDNNVRPVLEALLKLYAGDGAFAHSCREAIAMLRY
ncbi:unnamed protein product [Agarophyton chilense]